MKSSLVLALVLGAIQVSAFADDTYSRCQSIPIQDPSVSSTNDLATVSLMWKGQVRTGDIRNTRTQPSIFVSREDGQSSRIDQLNVQVLKKVPFETVRTYGEDGEITHRIATYKLKLTSKQYDIGTTTVEGDIMMPSKSTTEVVVCTTSTRKSN